MRSDILFALWRERNWKRRELRQKAGKTGLEPGRKWGEGEARWRFTGERTPFFENAWLKNRCHRTRVKSYWITRRNSWRKGIFIMRCLLLRAWGRPNWRQRFCGLLGTARVAGGVVRKKSKFAIQPGDTLCGSL